MKQKKGKEILKTGFLVMFLSMVFLLTTLSLDPDLISERRVSEKEPDQNIQKDVTSKEANDWTIYTNEEYLISFLYPRMLLKRVYEKTDEYDLFIVFEENQLTQKRGIAFGVSKIGSEEEVKRIKNNIYSQGEVKLVVDENLNIEKEKGRILLFEPQDKNLEKRSFLIIERGDYTYSFSTVPEQMQKIADSIQFLD